MPGGRPGARHLDSTCSRVWPSSSGSPSRTSPRCASHRSWSTPPAGLRSGSSSGLAVRSCGSPVPRSAEAVGVSQGTVVAWELGHRVPGTTQLPKIAAAMSVDVASLAAAMPRRGTATSPGRAHPLPPARARSAGDGCRRAHRHDGGHGEPLGERPQPPRPPEPAAPRRCLEGPLRQRRRCGGRGDVNQVRSTAHGKQVRDVSGGRRVRGDRGAALVEFAIIAPLVFMLIARFDHRRHRARARRTP